MELYYIIAVTDRDRSGEMAELYQAAGLHLTLTKLGRGTAPREALSIYGLDATPKARCRSRSSKTRSGGCRSTFRATA